MRGYQVLIGVVAATCVLAVSACDDDETGPAGPTAVGSVSGNNQTSIVGRRVTDSLSVRVSNAAGNPVTGITVAWAASSGGGSISPATSVTNASGIATAAWTLGPTAGAQTATATVTGLQAVTFSATARQNFAAALNGANERPPVTTAATGSATLTANSTGTAINFTIMVTGLSGPASGAHIHGPADANGVAGIIVPFTPLTLNTTGTIATGTTSTTSGGVTLDSVFVLMRTGRAYVNVHTTLNPGGEIRGQVTTP